MQLYAVVLANGILIYTESYSVDDLYIHVESTVKYVTTYTYMALYVTTHFTHTMSQKYVVYNFLLFFMALPDHS